MCSNSIKICCWGQLSCTIKMPCHVFLFKVMLLITEVVLLISGVCISLSPDIFGRWLVSQLYQFFHFHCFICQDQIAIRWLVNFYCVVSRCLGLFSRIGETCESHLAVICIQY